MKKAYALILIAILILGNLALIIALEIVRYSIPTDAQIKTLGLDVYEDVECTILLTYIAWGLIEPDSNVSLPIYVLSTSNAPILLGLLSENWNPLNATQWISLSWDYDNSLLDPDASIPLILTLSVSANIEIKAFSFDIVIMGQA